MQKKMMGGFVFIMNNKMFVEINGDEIMARIHPDEYQSSLTKEGCREMSFTGKPMKGFIFLSEEAIDLDINLHYWLQLALDFNPLAKASKKRKPSKI